jgi:hypothetical protein
VAEALLVEEETQRIVPARELLRARPRGQCSSVQLPQPLGGHIDSGEDHAGPGES